MLLVVWLLVRVLQRWVGSYGVDDVADIDDDDSSGDSGDHGGAVGDGDEFDNRNLVEFILIINWHNSIQCIRC